MKTTSQIVEAIIFAAGEPISKAELREKLPNMSKKDLDQALQEIKDKYGLDSGVILREFSDKVGFFSNPKYGETVRDALLKIREKSLTTALLQVLAVIAYRQPITRGEIEFFRASSAEYALMTLMKVGLIDIVGRKNTLGRPLLYGTTDEFLRKFGLMHISDLPDYEVIKQKIEALNERYNLVTEDALFKSRSILEVDESGNVTPEAEAKAKSEEIPFDVKTEMEGFTFAEGEDVDIID